MTALNDDDETLGDLASTGPLGDPASKEPLGDYAEGMAIRREVLGEDYVSKTLASSSDFNRTFQHLVTEHCWGTIWARDVLPRQTRSLLTVAMLVVLNHRDELYLHIRGALRNGCTEEEVSEVLLQAAVYGGIPAGVAAYRTAAQAIADHRAESQADH